LKIFFYNFFKRILDLIVSILGLLILSPIMLIIFILQVLVYKGKIFFNQKRVGLNGKIFRVYKFKTMNDKKDKNGILLPDNKRVTKIGKFLRTFSLDELPQIFNIISGTMSVVGPRPQSIEVCLFMSPEQFNRHKVKPGLTGLSAIRGRNGISWKKKIQYDLEYIERMNIFLDIKIIIITAIKVIIKENVFSEGNLAAITLGEELYKSQSITKDVYEKRHQKLRDMNSKKVFDQKDLITNNE